MLEFRTLNLDLTHSKHDAEEVRPSVFRAGEHFNYRVEHNVRFPRPIRLANCALQGYRFETRGDHLTKKLKIETRARVLSDSHTVHVVAEAHFGDVYPRDDIYDFMQVDVLIIADLV